MRPFPPHSLWVVTFVLLHFLTWWSVWDYREVEWNYARFLVVISSPLVLFFVSSLVLPRRVAGETVDLEKRFARTRPWLMGGYALLTLIYILDGPVAFGEPLLNAYRIPQSMSLAAALVGLTTEDRKAHLVIAIVALLVIAFASVLRFVPGAFAVT